MISILYIFDTSRDIQFIESSIICKSVLDNTDRIVTGLLTEIRQQPLTPNNKSTVITCLMTAYMLKHLGMQDRYDKLI